jgi:hypothetical protein
MLKLILIFIIFLFILYIIFSFLRLISDIKEWLFSSQTMTDFETRIERKLKTIEQSQQKIFSTLQHYLGVTSPDKILHTLLTEMKNCEPIVKHIKDNGTKQDQQIYELLYMDSIMEHWTTLVGQTFESNKELWTYLRDRDGGNWLNQLLRADDVLQTYFPNKESFKLLSQHLSIVNDILQAAFPKMGIKFYGPKILEKVPSYVPTKDPNYKYVPDPLLKSLVEQQVLEKYRQGVRDFVVDVETYGFGSANQVRVLVFGASEWGL